MVLANAAVMRAENPCFQVGKDEVNHGQMTVSLLWIARQCERIVNISQCWQRFITRPAVGSHGRACGDILLDESGQTVSATTVDDAKPQPPGIHQFFERDSALMLLFVLCRALFGI